MYYNEYIVLVVALTCVAWVPRTFLVILYRGTKGKREEHPPFALKRDRVSYAGYFSFKFDEEKKSLLKNCSVFKGRYFIILLNIMTVSFVSDLTSHLPLK